MLWANMDAADKIDESAELITAAEMAPRPIVETNGGVRCWSTRGRICIFRLETDYKVEFIFLISDLVWLDPSRIPEESGLIQWHLTPDPVLDYESAIYVDNHMTKRVQTKMTITQSTRQAVGSSLFPLIAARSLPASEETHSSTTLFAPSLSRVL